MSLNPAAWFGIYVQEVARAKAFYEAAKAANSGGQMFRDKFPIGQRGYIALVYDTEGNMIGLHSMV